MDVATGSALAVLMGHADTVQMAAFSPDGNRIVTASDGLTARLWDAKTGAPLANLTGHTNYVLSAAFSPDGTRIVTASADMTARLWNADSGAAIATLSGHTRSVDSAAFSPDGSRGLPRPVMEREDMGWQKKVIRCQFLLGISIQYSTQTSARMVVAW